MKSHKVFWPYDKHTKKLMLKMLGRGCLSTPYNCSFMKIKHRIKSQWKMLLNKFTLPLFIISVHMLYMLKVIARTFSFKTFTAMELGDLPCWNVNFTIWQLIEN